MTTEEKAATVELSARKERIPDHVVRRIAVEAGTDPRTVRRVIDGLPTRPLCRERVERGMVAAGRSDLVRQG